MKRIFLILFLLASVISAQVSYPPLWYPKTSTNLVTLGNYNVGINSLYNYMIGDTAIFRLRNGQVQFLSAGVWTAIPDTSISAGGWSDNGSNLTPTTVTDTIKMKYAAMITGGNWGSPAFNSPIVNVIDLTNQTSIQSTIATDKSRIYPYDNGSSVMLRAVVDDNGTETDKQILTSDGWSALGGYQFDGVDDYLTAAFTQQNYGVEFWIYPTVTNKAILNFGTNLGITFNSSNIVTYGSSFANTSTFINGVSGTTLKLNQWNYVQCFYDIITPTVLEVGRVSTTYLTGRFAMLRVWNRVLTAAEKPTLFNNGVPHLYPLPYADRGASQTSLVDTAASVFTSGTYSWTVYGANTKANVGNALEITYVNSDNGAYNYLRDASDLTTNLVVGKRYKVVLDAKYTGGSAGSTINLDAIVGYPLTTSMATYTLEFVCSAVATQNVRVGNMSAGNVVTIDNFYVYQIGNVLDLTAQNAGRIGWIDGSGNQLSGATSGSPICLNTEERPQQYRDIKKGIANTATALTSVIPKGYVIKEIRLKASASITGVKIGTSSGGEQVVASTTAGTTATLATLAATVNAGYSETADQTLYVEHATAGQTLDIIIKMEKVGN